MPSPILIDTIGRVDPVPSYQERSLCCRQVRQGSSAWSLLEIQPLRRNELRQPVADPHHPFRGMDLAVMPGA